MLCQYKDTLGVPGKGLHSYRLFDLAIIDFLSTILGSVIISRIFNTSFIYVFLALILSGIFLHEIFCVKTKLNQLLLVDLPKIFSS